MIIMIAADSASGMMLLMVVVVVVVMVNRVLLVMRLAANSAERDSHRMSAAAITCSKADGMQHLTYPWRAISSATSACDADVS